MSKNVFIISIADILHKQRTFMWDDGGNKRLLRSWNEGENAALKPKLIVNQRVERVL